MKNKIFFFLVLGLTFLISTFNVFQFSKENQVLDLSLNEILKIPRAMAEDPGGEPTRCAYLASYNGPFLHLVCTSQYTCDYAYGAFGFFDICYYIG
jgi:hypothetical protein